MHILSIPKFNPQYSQYKAAVNCFQTKKKTDYGYDVVCFTGAKQKPELKYEHYGKIPARLENQYLPNIDKFWHDYPDFTNRILYDTLKTDDGSTQPRFDAYGIRKLMALHKEEPQLVEELLKATNINEDGAKVHRFNEYNIQDLVYDYQTCPIFSKKLIAQKTKDKHGRTVYRFDAGNIHHLVSLYKSRTNNNGLLQELVDETYINKRGEAEYCWNYDDIIDIYSSKLLQNKRDAFKDNNLHCDIKRVLVRINDLTEIDALTNIIEQIRCQTGEIKSTRVLSNILNAKAYDFKDLNEYVSAIDFDKLHKTAPRTKSFDAKELLNFIEYHYENKNYNLDKESLTLTPDFTKYLSENYVPDYEMENILTIFPLTERNVGSMPDDWFKGIDKKAHSKKENALQKSISNFIKDSDTQALEKSFSTILNKETTVEKLGFGCVGTGYKVSVKDSPDVVLKTFHKTPRLVSQKHGRRIEPQVGMFLNNNSNNYVHMYFGRVCGKKDRDGYLITQYLNEDIIPIEGKDNPNYEIYSNDSCDGHNMINGKIIDYGGVFVEKEKKDFHFIRDYHLMS